MKAQLRITSIQSVWLRFRSRKSLRLWRTSWEAWTPGVWWYLRRSWICARRPKVCVHIFFHSVVYGIIGMCSSFAQLCTVCVVMYCTVLRWPVARCFGPVVVTYMYMYVYVSFFEGHLQFLYRDGVLNPQFEFLRDFYCRYFPLWFKRWSMNLYLYRRIW